MSNGRIAFWDNAKLITLALVVAGHMIDGIRFDGLAPNWLYTFIYLFHMPVMVFITGYFSHAEMSRKVANSIFQLVAAYIVWELIIGFLRYLLDGDLPPENFLTTPSRAMWFLISLATWKAMLPLLRFLKHPLVFAVIVSLAVGAFRDIDATLSVSRTLGFLPFFVGGYVAKERSILAGSWFVTPSRRLRALAGALLVAVGGLLWFGLEHNSVPAAYRWLYRRYNYWQLTDGSRERITILPAPEIVDSSLLTVTNGAIANAVSMLLATAIGLAFLLLIPRTRSFMSQLGQNTLYIYLLHIPFIHLESHFGVAPAVFSHLGIWGLTLIIAISVVLACALGVSPLKRFFRPVVEPNVAPLMRA